MNIKRAKEEIRNTIEAYLLKNEYGEYEIPVMAQLPCFSYWRPWNRQDTDHGADFPGM